MGDESIGTESPVRIRPSPNRETLIDIRGSALLDRKARFPAQGSG